MASILNAAMTRADSPVTYLSASPISRRPQIRVNFVDYAVLTGALVVIAGGCLAVLDMGTARSTGQESYALSLINGLSHGLPALMGSLGKYALLLLASVLNSAMLVALVCGLRSVDRRVGKSAASARTALELGSRSKAQNVRGKSTRVLSRESSPFLLSPVFR